MSWGKNAEVIEPKELRERVKAEVAGLAANYSK